MEEIIHIYRVYKQHGEDEYEQYSSNAIFTYDELENKIKEKYENFDFGKEKRIQILEYTSSGRVKNVEIGNVNISGVELRTILGLKSTKFEIILNDNIEFNVIGYGHGVRYEPNWCRCISQSWI